MTVSSGDRAVCVTSASNNKDLTNFQAIATRGVLKRGSVYFITQVRPVKGGPDRYEILGKPLKRLLADGKLEDIGWSSTLFKLTGRKS